MKAIALAHILILLRISTVFSQQQSGCPLSGADEKFLIQRRMQGLRANLLAQLGLTSSNVPPSAENVTLTKDQMDAYLALTQAASSVDAERERRCQSDEIYAQPITTIVGEINDNLQYKTKRNVKRLADNNILNTIDIEFNFNLKESLTSITRGDFLLYQHAVTSYDNVMDEIQYVEIKAVLESMGLKTVVAAKNMNIYNEGFQSFDISSAINLWIDRQINGTVQLEVTITCLSSKRCATKVDRNGNPPMPIKFEFEVSARKPRLVVVSQNPLEAENQRRFRRQSDGNSSRDVSFCVPKQSTCCVKELSIRFKEDLNMPFVIVPKKFPANYCEGICPITAGGDLMTPELYGFLSKLTNHPAASIEPCCAGNKFKPLVIILPDPNDPGSIIIEEIQNVSVESCRCA